MKKSGAAIFLMELLVVILFFSLSIRTTLNLFMTAYNKEKESSCISEALLEAQNAAERFRALGADAFSNENWDEKSLEGGVRIFTYTKNDTGLFIEISMKTENTGSGNLDKGEVRAYINDKKEDEPLCSLKLTKYSAAAVRGVSQ